MVKWDYEKKEKRVLHILDPRRHCLDYSKVYSDVTERWLLAKTNKLHIKWLQLDLNPEPLSS